MSTLFALLATDPQPGTVKPALAEAIGAPMAAKIYRSCIMDLCERFSALSVQSRLVAYAPRGARKAVGLLASRHWRMIQQVGNTPGQTLENIFEQAMRTGHQRVVILVSDCPTIPDAFVIDAFDQLMIADVVLGPTTDGGIYLIGMSLERPEMFRGIDWTGDAVFDTLVERTEAFGLILGLVPHWYDVKGRAGLDCLASHLKALAVVGSEAMPKRTQTLLAKLKLIK
jgi:glycosyltransferase A (GT-A) superfamily protein (DUF2064 family)